MKPYLIIGAGAAGVSAIEGIRSQDPYSEIIQVFDEGDGYYSRPGLAYYLTGEVSEDSLFPFQLSHFEQLKVKQINTRAKRIYPFEHKVELANGSMLSYQKLLISTGAHAAPAKVPGIELEGVIKLDNLADARKIMKYARKRRTAVIVGGGITALELVEGFRSRGLQVHYFLRGNRYWSNVLDETESHIVEQRLEEEGVQIHYHTELAEIIGNRGKVNEVLTTDGRKIKCDVVGIAIGIKPRKFLAEHAGLTADRGILVNEYLQSDDPDIFAAGDVAEVYDPRMGKAILDSLWTPARKQGYLAGLNMTGKKVPYSKGMPFNVTRLAGLTTTIIGALGSREEDYDVVGIVRGDSEGWRQMPDALVAQSGFDVNRLRVLIGENHLVGALLMGDQTLSRAIHRIITEKVDITPIREKLLRPNRAITEIIADFWSQIADSQGNIVHATIQS
jgi:3-phenylpropionate/trans-cinnamate dioxygenase ferredoxin reductase component